MYNLQDAKSISKGKGCKYVHLNCRSLYPKLTEISETFSSFDFVSLSETWLTDKHTDVLINMPDKKVFRQDRSWLSNDGGIVKKGGGVAVYVGSKWSPFVTIDRDTTCSSSDIEILTLLVEKTGRRHMTIVTVYRPPNGNCLEFIAKLTNIITHIKNRNSEIWIMGDFNINILDRGNRFVKLLNRFAIDFDLKQLISGKTRLNYRGGSCIDLMFTDRCFVQCSGVLNDMISDHLPVYACRKQKRNDLKFETVTGRSYKRYNQQHFKVLLEQCDWDELLQDCDTEQMWLTVMTEICSILAIMCPLKTFKIPVHKPEWLTDEILTCINDRNKYIGLFKRTGCLDFLVLSKHLRTKITKLNFKEKRSYILTKLNNNKKNPKNFLARN